MGAEQRSLFGSFRQGRVCFQQDKLSDLITVALFQFIFKTVVYFQNTKLHEGALSTAPMAGCSRASVCVAVNASSDHALSAQVSICLLVKSTLFQCVIYEVFVLACCATSIFTYCNRVKCTQLQ